MDGISLGVPQNHSAGSPIRVARAHLLYCTIRHWFHRSIDAGSFPAWEIEMRRYRPLSLFTIFAAAAACAGAQESQTATLVRGGLTQNVPLNVSISGRVRMPDGSPANHARAYLS